MRFQWYTIPILTDNYIYVLRDNHKEHVLAVDPGESATLIDFLKTRKWSLNTILLTHHHPDHIDGCQKLREHYHCDVLGAASDQHRLPLLNRGLIEGEIFFWSQDLEVHVMAAPGHTRHHVLYFLPKIPLLFCGDTLFSAGCGRLFEGTAQEMWTTFQTLLSLPDNTIMACTHEYSLANILFALSILPQDPDIQKRLQDVQSLLDNHTPTVPTLLSLEKKINLFLRCADPQVVAALQLSPYTSEYQVFAELRRRRDNFIPSN